MSLYTKFKNFTGTRFCLCIGGEEGRVRVFGETPSLFLEGYTPPFIEPESLTEKLERNPYKEEISSYGIEDQTPSECFGRLFQREASGASDKSSFPNFIICRRKVREIFY